MSERPQDWDDDDDGDWDFCPHGFDNSESCEICDADDEKENNTGCESVFELEENWE